MVDLECCFYTIHCIDFVLIAVNRLGLHEYQLKKQKQLPTVKAFLKYASSTPINLISDI